MSYHDTKGAGPSTGYPIVPVPAPEGSLTGAPPPYSACFPYPPTINSNYPDQRSPIPYPPANPPETSPLYGPQHTATAPSAILHDAAARAPFLDVPPGSEDYDTGHIPRTTPYNPQPSYNPSYTANQQNNPRINVYGKKTIVLQRTDAENSARKRKQLIAACVIIVIFCLIPIIVLTTVFTTVPRRGRRVEFPKTETANDHSYNSVYDGRIFDSSRNDHSYNNVYDGRTFDNSRVKPNDPYLTDRHNDNSDDLSWKPKNRVTTPNPFLDDKYKSKVDNEPWKPDTDDDIFRELGIVIPDYKQKMKEVLDWEKHDDKFPVNPVVRPIGMTDDMKDMLGIPRRNNMDNISQLYQPNNVATADKQKSVK